MSDLVEYLSDAISRVERGDVASPTGSWLAGIFGEAARLFEKDLRSYVDGLLETCGLTYEKDLRGTVAGAPMYEKLTMGQLIVVIRKAGEKKPHITSQHVPGGRKLSEFLEEVKAVNDTWVARKHGGEIEEKLLLVRMKTMLKLAKSLREEKL